MTLSRTIKDSAPKVNFYYLIIYDFEKIKKSWAMNLTTKVISNGSSMYVLSQMKKKRP